MQFIRQLIPDVVLIKPAVHIDNRGYFVERFRQDQFEAAMGFAINFCQDNETRSSKGVLRGLHFQRSPHAQNKLVWVVEGEVQDIAVDIRQGSPTYGQAITAILNDCNKHQLFIPKGFAHGFLVLSEIAVIAYKVDNYYAPEFDSGLAYDDAALGIDWLLPKELIKLSDKDQNLPGLVNFGAYFEYEMNCNE